MRRNIEYRRFYSILYIIENKKNHQFFYILYYRKAKRKKINELGDKRAHFCSEISTQM